MPLRLPIDNEGKQEKDGESMQEHEHEHIRGKNGQITLQSPHGTGRDNAQDSSSVNHTQQESNSSAQAISTVNDLHMMRRVITSLPRPQTFLRQQSEKRDRLLPVPQSETKRRPESTGTRSCSGHATVRQFASAPELVDPTHGWQSDVVEKMQEQDRADHTEQSGEEAIATTDGADDAAAIQQQFRDHWILNLSMHFRDKSNREKFFITYAQTPSLWRRMTVSLDYRDASADSLEAELKDLDFQRDKSFRIFDALRESLPEIQFYETVTNLKLQTTPEDGQLHVHVREDANEIIDYPSALLLHHIDCDRFTESELSFHSHISGFVYQVVVGGRMLIKKEIPGPDTIEEFLYEVNALDALQDYENVIQLQGLITSNDGVDVKGLLIPYCTKGALVDVLYDWKAEDLSLELRLKWARQIIQGLSNIHEAGFVQGDFTLSNIVIDGDNNAHIIDINRRGCPVGWEPPELSTLIDQGQRISMYIGVKTDLFQLGMVLWGLARLNDEPERCPRPLDKLREMPAFYADIVSRCLKDRPQARPSAAMLLRRMDRGLDLKPTLLDESQHRSYSSHPTSTHRADREYINPEAAVTIDDVKGGRNSGSYSNNNDDEQSPTIPSRGRSPGCSSRRRSSFFDGANTSATSISASSCRNTRDAEDFDEKHYDMLADLGQVPPSYHRLQHEDSGFDEYMT